MHPKLPWPSERGDSKPRVRRQRFQPVRFVLYSAQEIAAASESLLAGTFGDVNQRTRAMGYAPMASKQDQEKRCKPPRRQPLGNRASTPGRGEMPARPAGLDPVVADIIEAVARTMVDNDHNKQRRLVELKDGCRYGKFGKTKAYELIAQERIRAYKMGGKTMIDLDSVDEYHASLPRVESRAS